MPPTKTVRPMPLLLKDTMPTMTYDPATIEATFRVIHKYKELLKPLLMSRLFMMVEAESDIKLQYAMKEVTHGYCRYHDGLTSCITTSIPYTQQGLLVTDSTVMVKEGHWLTPNGFEMQRLEMFIAIDGKPVEYLPQRFYWLL